MRPTDRNQELFSVKLRELEQRQEEAAARLHRLQRADHAQVRRELEQLQREEREEERALRERADTGRSPAVAALSRAQLEYLRRVRAILREDLPASLHRPGAGALEDQTEAACLYGEYAMDAAAQATRHALTAALRAVDLGMCCREREQASQHIEEEFR